MFQRLKNIYHKFVAFLANLFFLFPGRKLVVVGVTGTDGKTTTVSLIYHILKSAEKKVSMLSSISAYIGDKEYETGFHVTTPSPFALQKFLKKAVDQGSEYFVLEVTSHALDQHRIWGIPFKIGVLTNVTNEHLDYHKTYENYVKTKEKLLRVAKIAVVSKDDGSYKLLGEARKTKKDENWITFGLSKNADLNPANFPFESKVLLGDFNKLNALSAAACCRVLGLSDKSIKDAIKTFKMPTGRFDFVYRKDFSVVIDFAHTPNAFEQILSSLRPEVLGRIIHVFGSAGERDRLKRPVMGEISAKFADVLVLTAEDPRSEDPDKIIDEVASGIKKKDVEVLKITDREKAIKAALEMVRAGDLVLITGKAHEKSMTFGKEDHPWDEYKTVEEALDERA